MTHVDPHTSSEELKDESEELKFKSKKNNVFQDQLKLNKAGNATPRGGTRGAYQNHVVRSNRVIIPYEHKDKVGELKKFEDGYIYRLFPNQYFKSAWVVKEEFVDDQSSIQIGKKAFVLYGSHKQHEQFPPFPEWEVRKLIKEGKKGEKGKEVKERRGKGIVDDGHYVLRMSNHGEHKKQHEGPPQGIFAPEYANEETNFLCRCVLAWLIIHTVDSPYRNLPFSKTLHLKTILLSADLLRPDDWEFYGILVDGNTTCPLCMEPVSYKDLHKRLILEGEDALENAGDQVEGATRATMVNLFHLAPLRYDRLDHRPESVAWGHAVCNTKLGQRKCYSINELKAEGKEFRIGSGTEPAGWMSSNREMIRTEQGEVWIRISRGNGNKNIAAASDIDKDLPQVPAESYK
ncbi:hypothetical protein [Massilia alkalitolerans]|uniref:hypothetical protein n=1 Tax=Massilia alkalitolerans TaxID=286638 RepID=UPI0028AE5BE3|nr:hypothetical protein [Massilia alkalitolerans]